MNAIQIREAACLPMSRQPQEYVERKGIGHPDTICDSIMESIAVALASEYLRTAGRILHYNVDKGLLVAGRTEPRLGGGKVLEPMRIIIGDRATRSYDGHEIEVGEIAESTARQWLTKHLRFVEPSEHLVVQNELREGSPELTGIFARQEMIANDTSVGVGFAPLSETESLVLSAERYLNSASFKHDFPEAGEDVKIMGIRSGSCEATMEQFSKAACGYRESFVGRPGLGSHASLRSRHRFSTCCPRSSTLPNCPIPIPIARSMGSVSGPCSSARLLAAKSRSRFATGGESPGLTTT